MAENTTRCAELLRDLLRDYPDHAALAADIRVCEHEGDRVTRELIVELNESPARRRPFSVSDGHSLATAVDDIVDFADQTAELLSVYGIEAPTAQAEGMSGVLVAASAEVGGALRELAAGEDYRARLGEIHRLENVGDRLLREGLGSLFAQGIDPMYVIRWKDIFESLEQSIDACEHVANLLEGIWLRRQGRRN